MKYKEAALTSTRLTNYLSNCGLIDPVLFLVSLKSIRRIESVLDHNLENKTNYFKLVFLLPGWKNYIYAFLCSVGEGEINILLTMVTIALNNSAADIRQKFHNSTCHARDTL